EAGHVLHRRADDQSRGLRGQSVERWLDGGHARPLDVGAVRAQHRRDGEWLRNLHALPQRLARATLSLTAPTQSGGAARFHIITAIVRGCGSALLPAAPTRFPIMS